MGSCRRLSRSYMRRIGCRRQFRDRPRAVDGNSEVLNLGGLGETKDKRDEEPRRKGEETF